jgi:smad nuclear-interacting protein 1
MARKSRSRSRSRDRQRTKHRSRSRSRDRRKRDKPPREERGPPREDRGGSGVGDSKWETQDRKQYDRKKEVTKTEHAERAEALKPETETEEAPKEGVNLGLSGALTEETNTFNGVVVKYSEPPEARKPKRRWRFYVFKGEEVLPVLHIHRQSAFLMGRDRKVCDLPIDHPSCSKQHAVFQYRMVNRKRDDGTQGNKVIPYIIDLGSANGTYLNNTRIESNRYYELQEKDMLKFGFSTREYVLLHGDSE